jgi:hypothetical protein
MPKPRHTLRKIIIILTLFYFCKDTFAQTDECQIGIDSAQTDYSVGILRTYIFGLTNTFTYGKILKDEYGIEAVYWGCIVDKKWDCYSKFMDEKIKIKFGDDIFEKAAKKSEQLDSLGKGDRQSEFPGGEEELIKFIYCNLDLVKANYSESKKGRVNLQFSIDKSGRPVNILVRKSPNESYSKEAIRLINLMPNWITATENGKTINQMWNLPIVFDDKWKEEHCP